MQQYIDNMNEQLELANAQAEEVNNIKQNCYNKIEIIQNKNEAKDKNENESIEDEKQWIKEVIS